MKHLHLPHHHKHHRQVTVAEHKRNKRWMIGGSCLIVVGVFFFLLGILIQFVVFPVVMEALIYESIKLKPDTDAWDGWLEPPVPVYYNFKFFHVENPDAFSRGEKPSVVEAGPYSFLEIRQKEQIFSADVDLLNYGQYYEFYWDQRETNDLGCMNAAGEYPCTGDDPITILNPVLAAVVPMLLPKRGDSPADAADKIEFLDKLDEALTNSTACHDCQEGIFITTTPMEFLFDGYQYKTIRALAYALRETSSSSSSAGRRILGRLADKYGYDLLSLPDLPDLPLEIGILSARNMSVGDEYYTINNGMVDPQRLLNIEKYKGLSELPDEWWPDAPATPSAADAGLKGVCGDLYGTDGTQFQPYPDTDLWLWVFISDLCRPLWLEYTEDSQVRGIDTYEYRPPASVFDMHDPDNYCYCPDFFDCAVPMEDGTDQWNFTGCDPVCKDGMIRVEGCSGGAPIVMSAPHFLYGDPSLWEAVDGLSPSQQWHDTFMHVEVMSGVPLSGHKKIQMAVNMECTDLVTPLSGCNSVLFPVFWADEAADLDDENYELWVHDVERPTKMVLGFCIAAGMVLGFLIAAGGIYLCWKA